MSVCIRDLKVEMVAAADLKPYAGNPRTHSNRQLRQIAKSITVMGWTNPILIDAGGVVIAGAGRLQAAKLLGLEIVPVIRIQDMTTAQIRAYVIADNKLAENAGWDRELLALELKGLIEIDIDFDIETTGFEMAEIDIVIGAAIRHPDDDDPLPNVDHDQPPVSRLGDLWQLGRHRLLCADATQPASLQKLMGGARAQMAFADPPFNVRIQGHVSGRGAARHDEFAMASGEMSEAEFAAFLKGVLAQVGAHSSDGAIHFVCMDWRHFSELLTAARDVYSELKNVCVWVKSNAGMGSLYRSQHELVAVFKYGSAPHINNVELGRYGRNRSNVWTYPGMNSFGADRNEVLAMHPTVKPVRLVEDAILDCSNRGDIVLDPFVGSGTTIIAAERAGRHGYGIEIERRYVDIALRRFRSLTGIEIRHAQSGLSYSEIEKIRLSHEGDADAP